MSVIYVGSSSIFLSWSVPNDTVVTGYEVVWMEQEKPETSRQITDTAYTIEQLHSSTQYTIIVRATNNAGTTDSFPIFVITGKFSTAVGSTHVVLLSFFSYR